MTRLTVERLFSSPSLNGSVPTQVRFSPDGDLVTYLANPPEDRERLDLYAYDIARGASSRLIDASRVHTTLELTDAEKSERERRRQFSGGISSYRWLPNGKHLCCAIDGSVYLYDREYGSLRAITLPGLRQTDVTVSPGGRFISYVRDGDLYLYDLSAEREERLTHDASDFVTNGQAEFVAQEEMHRFEGHWWAPDDARIVFARVDNSTVASTYRYEFTADELIAVAQRYPYAGAANARVDLGVLELSTRAVRWLEYRRQSDDYLARVNVGSSYTAVQTQSRDQRTLTLTAFPFDGTAPRELLTERQLTWINLHNNFRFVEDGTAFLWTSERTGSSQLYLYRSDGAALQLTRGPGRINEVLHADAMHAWALGWTERPTEQHLFRVALDGGGRLDALTKIPGWHEAVIDPTGSRFVDRYSNMEQPTCLELHALKTELPVRSLAANALVEGHPYHAYIEDHATPTFGSIRAADGQELWYRLTLPRNGAQRRVPVLVSVYGGPGVQRVRNEWSPLTNQIFVGLGIAVFELDNRGGANRDKAFEAPIHRRLGKIEIEDQLAGIDFVRRQPWADADRIGVIGHSYGGFMTLMLMARNAGQIRAGISTAPVTDWRLYDTHYTERYLTTPLENPDGYRDSCVLTHVDAISGALLLMHGMADDNVLFGNSSALMKALQSRQYPFELMLYPGAKHALQDRDVAIHRYRTTLDFLERKLLS